MDFMEQILMNEYPQFRRIWVQRSKYSLCVTVFPLEANAQYQILTRQGIYHGFGQDTDINDVRSMIDEHLRK